MSDTPPERNSNSKSNLIEVQHVGVTAKLQSPLKNLLQTTSSSTETDNNNVLYQNHSKSKYNKFSNETHADTTTDTSKVLYEMHAIRSQNTSKHFGKVTPSKIEFQLYNKASKRRRRDKSNVVKTKRSKRKLFEAESRTKRNDNYEESTIFQRLRESLQNIRQVPKAQKSTSKIFDDLPEPPTTTKRTPLHDIRIGMYPFEHGCAEYLRTTDCHPQILSVMLAERATHYSTRFWAEVFGSLHIGVTFIVTFLLQSYRFILYSLVNTLIVGFLHMTSDYLIKPLLTVIFNGYLQPPLIFVYNIFSSMRDILEPIADTLNNFMKPVATVGRSLRLVHASYNNPKFTKEV